MPKKALLPILGLFFTTILSGCTVVGSTKPAALQITSTPEASVFLDGKHLGKTPFFSDQLEPKEYLVKITSGEAVYSEKVTLSQSTLTVINRELNNNFLGQSGEILWLDEGSGLFITSLPNQANISIDGQFLGTTPTKLDQLEEGEHKVLLSKQGYIDREFSIKTSSNYQLSADVTLASEAAKGQVPAASPLPQVQMVEVRNTPQGFLRVRREPTTASSEIGRVQDGDSLELLQETDDWMQVKFEDKQGWVSSQYIEKL